MTGLRDVAAHAGRLFRANALFAVAVAALIAVSAGQFTRSFDNFLASWRSDLVQRSASQSLLVVEIDSQSVQEAGAWPWPRSRFAQAIHNLRRAGAELIAFDVDFSARSTAAEDTALHDAIGIDPATVVLPAFVQPGGLGENTPLASLSENAVVGSVNIPVDHDGVVRRYMTGYTLREAQHASIAGILANAPYGETRQFLIDYGIRESSIPHLSFQDVFAGTFDPALVRSRHILVGATALELGDEFSTPARPAMPGVYVHALAYESMVQERMLTRLSEGLVLVLALVVLALLWPRRAPLNLNKVLVRHGAVASGLVFGPLALQAASPVTTDVALIWLAQAFCVLASVQKQLSYRRTELLRQREEHLTYIAFHDPETQLPNRRAMLETLKRSLAANKEGVIAAVAIGVDRFSTLRGAIGYANANEIVALLAERVGAMSGQNVHLLTTSVIGVVLTAPDAATAQQHCLSCIQNLDTAIDIGGQTIDTTIRVGAATSSPTDANAEELLEQATLAMDFARMRNRRHVMYDPAEIADPLVQLALISDIGRGIARGEFKLLYQPKADARNGAIIGAEALMRWTHPVHGGISPDRFIGVAEETGAIDDLTNWALLEAIADQAQMRSIGVSVTISVNLSARSLVDRAFCDGAIAAISESSADICFEITETAIIADPQSAIASITAFHEAGVKISIDDYGSGLSSLGYLKQIAADELKLDKSLVGDLMKSNRDRLILKSTIDLAHSLGMSVVAEGIEDSASRAAIAALGCDSVQGYVISRPVPLDELTLLCGGGMPAAVNA